MNEKPSFSVGEYDHEGDQINDGIYLHFEGCRVRVADNEPGFARFIQHIEGMQGEINEVCANT